MKLRLSVYLDPGLMQQLTELADRKEQPRSLVAEAAIASFLTPDEGDRREAAFSRRLDLLTRQVDRLERDHMISAEALALFIRFWLTVTSSLPESRKRTCRRRETNVTNYFLRRSVNASQKVRAYCVRSRPTDPRDRPDNPIGRPPSCSNEAQP